jgi:glyoxylase-like metal-dependent hydrolase (beta-lactamase superfamily II)
VPARLIDVLHLGRERVIGCWQLEDVLIDPGPASCVGTLLAELGEQRPRALLLTHIHLDHAGASGTLVERWPDLEVYVHERGAPHLIDPSRLLESARRLYGDDMDRLWGETLPVPEDNVRVLSGCERLFGGTFEVAYTPGHASHHVSYLHERTAYAGDTAGVRITVGSLTILPTPPPDIDLEAWRESIERIAAWEPDRLAVTHFGAYDDVEAQLESLSARLDDWARRVCEQDRETFIAGIEEEIARGAEPGTTAAYAQAAPPDQVFMGLERYWRKRAEAAAEGDPAARGRETPWVS